MARRNEDARKQAERVAAVRAAEEAKAKAEALKDSYKTALGPKLRDWSEVSAVEALHPLTPSLQGSSVRYFVFGFPFHVHSLEK